MPKPKKQKPPHPCACGCGLSFQKGRFTKYSPDCQTPLHIRYSKKQQQYQADYKKKIYSKATFKIEPKGKGKRCSCGCGKPVGKGKRFLSDECYRRGSDRSEEHHWHTRHPAMTDNKR